MEYVSGVFSSRHTGEFGLAKKFDVLITITEILEDSAHPNHYTFSFPDATFCLQDVKFIMSVPVTGSLLATCDYGTSRSTAIMLHTKQTGNFIQSVKHVADNHPDGRLFAPNLSFLAHGLDLLGMDKDISWIEETIMSDLTENEILKRFRDLS